MKAIQLFFKDQCSFLVFQGFLVVFLLLLFWLDGFREYSTMLYAIFISILLTCTFLIAKFILRRAFYTAVTKQPRKLEDVLIRHVHGPEHRRVALYNRAIYKIYQHEVQSLYAAQSRQLEFMNQWVHQMKTPISVMNLLLQEEALDRKSLSEEVNRIQAGLDSVLVNARLETFERDMTIEKVNLKQVVQETVTEHKSLLIRNHVFPVISIDESFFVATDLKWLRIVIGQFITNAVKYTFESGKKIYLEAMKQETGITFSVRDEGVGIPSSDIHRITQAFFTGENGRLTGESTGMGLYIAAEVCERLGHTLGITSEVGVGTIITIEFENGKAEEATADEHNRIVERSDEDL